MTMWPVRALHPVEAFGLRIEGPSEEEPSRTVALFYTGDTDLCESIIEGARGVDLLLSEVGFTSDETEPDMHMDGRRAGEVARRAGVKRMLATHIQPWTPRERVAAEIRQTWDGPLGFAAAGLQVSL